jgi:hypothetical protein
MSDGIRIEGHQEIIESFRNIESNINRLGRSFLKGLSDYTVKQAQIHILNVGAVDTNTLIESIDYQIKQTTRGLQSEIAPGGKAQDYAAAVELGSKPHWPPISALQGWADRHGIPAFLVARKIAMEGTEPRFFWRDTFEDLDKHVDSEISDFAEQLARYF